MKRRIAILICILALLLAGTIVPAGGFADGEHPITLSITVDPMPELEGEGTVPDMLFTIFNDSASDYTMYNAKLSGGYDDVERPLDEKIEVLAGGKREFTLTDVPVAEDQLDVPVTYTLSWEEHEPVFDEETGEALIDDETGEAVTITHLRETSADIMIERFIVPELTVSAFCENELVRVGETFTVEYTLKNDTLFDMTGLRLYDPEQGLQSIPLKSDELTAGQTMVVPVTYTMGVMDMTFRPTVEYVARRRNITTVAETTIGVGCVTVDLTISTQAFPPTEEGTEFIVTVKNNGNRTVTGIQVYDEINTPVDKPFDLPANQTKSLRYIVKPGVAADYIRTVRFHATGTDALQTKITITDPESFSVTPYIEQEGVRIELRVEPQKPYFDGNGKLCVAFQFRIGYYGDVRLRNAVLTETTLFHEVVSYPELLRGETFFTQTYQIDGVGTLCFRVDAEDPAGQMHSSETVTVDTTPFRDQVDRKTDPVYVVTTNPYMQDLDTKYRGILKLITVIALGVAAFCAIVCIVLYIFERRIRNKLPGEFEEDMEKALRATKRRPDDPLFNDTPTERFGYRQPIKMRNYGELTEEEAKTRRELYARGLTEDLRREGERPAERPAVQKTPVRIDGDGTRVLPTAKPTATRTEDGTRIMPTAKPAATAYARPAEPVTPRPKGSTGEFRRPIAEPAAAARPTDETTTFRRPAEPVTPRPKGTTGEFRRPTAEPAAALRQTDETATFRRPAEPVTPRPKGSTGEFRRPIVEPAAASRPTDETAAFRRPAEPVTPRPKGNTGEFRRPTAEAAARTSSDTGVFHRPDMEAPAAARPTPRSVSETIAREAHKPETRDGASLLYRIRGFDEPSAVAVTTSAAAAIIAVKGEEKGDLAPTQETALKERTPEPASVPEPAAERSFDTSIQPPSDEGGVGDQPTEGEIPEPEESPTEGEIPESDASTQPPSDEGGVGDQPTEGEIPEPESPTKMENPEASFTTVTVETTPQSAEADSSPDKGSSEVGEGAVVETDPSTVPSIQPPSDEGGVGDQPTEGEIPVQNPEPSKPQLEEAENLESAQESTESSTDGENPEQISDPHESVTEEEPTEADESPAKREPTEPDKSTAEGEISDAEPSTPEAEKGIPIEEIPISFPIPSFLLRGIRLDSTAERAAAEAKEKQNENQETPADTETARHNASPDETTFDRTSSDIDSLLTEKETSKPDGSPTEGEIPEPEESPTEGEIPKSDASIQPPSDEGGVDGTTPQSAEADRSPDKGSSDVGNGAVRETDTSTVPSIQPPSDEGGVGDQPTEGEIPVSSAERSSDASTQPPSDEGGVGDQPTEGAIPEPEESPTKMENPEASFTTVTVETTPQSAEADSSPDKGSSDVGNEAVVETDPSTEPSIQPPSDEGGVGEQPTEGETSEPVEAPTDGETSEPIALQTWDEPPEPLPEQATVPTENEPPEPTSMLSDPLPEPVFLRRGPRRMEAQAVPARRPVEHQSIRRMNR